jgi:hypothetical protein
VYWLQLWVWLQEMMKLSAVQADRAATDQFFQELSQREETLQKRRVEIEHQEKSLAKLQEELEGQRQELGGRQEALEKALNEAAARTALTDSGAAAVGDADTRRREQDLSLRQERLERDHQLLRERSKALVEAEGVQPQAQAATAAAGEGTESPQQRQALLEVKQFLEASEAEMVRRWATHKAGGLAVTALLAAAMLAIFSTMLGHRLASPVWQASAVVVLPVVGETEPSLQEQRQMLVSDLVVRDVLMQLRQRNVRLFGDPATLADDLDRHTRLVRENGFKTRIVYQASGEDGRELSVQMVDAVARAMAEAQLSKLPANSDLQPSVAQPGAREPQPVRDWRWPLSGFFFAAGLVVFGAAVYFGRRWLQKAPRVLDVNVNMPAVAALSSDEQWQALTGR